MACTEPGFHERDDNCNRQGTAKCNETKLSACKIERVAEQMRTLALMLSIASASYSQASYRTDKSTDPLHPSLHQKPLDQLNLATYLATCT